MLAASTTCIGWVVCTDQDPVTSCPPYKQVKCNFTSLFVLDFFLCVRVTLKIFSASMRDNDKGTISR